MTGTVGRTWWWRRCTVRNLAPRTRALRLLRAPIALPFLILALISFHGCTVTDAAKGADRIMARDIDLATETFHRAASAYEGGEFERFRAICGEVLELEVPPYQKSYAHLRIAQGYVAEGDLSSARREYEKLVSDPAAPEVHRFEASARIEEIDRTSRGEPARDPRENRTEIPEVHPSVEFFVSPDGNDNGDGSADRPFATLERARDRCGKRSRRGFQSAGSRSH